MKVYEALFLSVLAGAMTTAMIIPSRPVYPPVRAVWLPQPARLGPVQAPQQERHDKHKDDADAYCFNPNTSGSQTGQRQRDPHGHECHCHLVCQVGPDNAVIGDSEDSTCELYCTRERCSCHVESPCEMPQGGH